MPKRTDNASCGPTSRMHITAPARYSMPPRQMTAAFGFRRPVRGLVRIYCDHIAGTVHLCTRVRRRKTFHGQIEPGLLSACWVGRSTVLLEVAIGVAPLFSCAHAAPGLPGKNGLREAGLRHIGGRAQCPRRSLSA